MLTVEWVDAQIKDLSAQPASMAAVRDLSALLTVRAHLVGSTAQPLATLTDIENALHAITARTPEEARRLRDAQTILDIVSSKTA